MAQISQPYNVDDKDNIVAGIKEWNLAFNKAKFISILTIALCCAISIETIAVNASPACKSIFGQTANREIHSLQNPQDIKAQIERIKGTSFRTWTQMEQALGNITLGQWMDSEQSKIGKTAYTVLSKNNITAPLVKRLKPKSMTETVFDSSKFFAPIKILSIDYLDAVLSLSYKLRESGFSLESQQRDAIERNLKLTDIFNEGIEIKSKQLTSFKAILHYLELLETYNVPTFSFLSGLSKNKLFNSKRDLLTEIKNSSVLNSQVLRLKFFNWKLDQVQYINKLDDFLVLTKDLNQWGFNRADNLRLLVETYYFKNTFTSDFEALHSKVYEDYVRYQKSQLPDSEFYLHSLFNSIRLLKADTDNSTEYSENLKQTNSGMEFVAALSRLLILKSAQPPVGLFKSFVNKFLKHDNEILDLMTQLANSPYAKRMKITPKHLRHLVTQFHKLDHSSGQLQDFQNLNHYINMSLKIQKPKNFLMFDSMEDLAETPFIRNQCGVGSCWAMAGAELFSSNYLDGTMNVSIDNLMIQHFRYQTRYLLYQLSDLALSNKVDQALVKKYLSILGDEKRILEGASDIEFFSYLKENPNLFDSINNKTTLSFDGQVNIAKYSHKLSELFLQFSESINGKDPATRRVLLIANLKEIDSILEFKQSETNPNFNSEAVDKFLSSYNLIFSRINDKQNSRSTKQLTKLKLVRNNGQYVASEPGLRHETLEDAQIRERIKLVLSQSLADKIVHKIGFVYREPVGYKIKGQEFPVPTIKNGYYTIPENFNPESLVVSPTLHAVNIIGYGTDIYGNVNELKLSNYWSEFIDDGGTKRMTAEAALAVLHHLVVLDSPQSK